MCLSQHGTPPLLIAAGCGNIQIIEVLMRKGAEIQANDKVMIVRMLLSGRFWLTATEINIGKGMSCRAGGWRGGFFSIDKCNHEPGALCRRQQQEPWYSVLMHLVYPTVNYWTVKLLNEFVELLIMALFLNEVTNLYFVAFSTFLVVCNYF